MSMQSPPPDRWKQRGALAVLVVYWLVLLLATHWPISLPSATPPHFDKFAHLVAYAGLGFLLALNWSLHRTLTWVSIGALLLVLAVYAACDEVLQIPLDRTAELGDWQADIAGALLGLLCVRLLGSGPANHANGRK
jgi:VanZ family protein